MPSIVLFRRRWNIADDDLFLPPLIEAVCRFGWLVASALLVWENHPRWLCGDADKLAFAYQVGSQVIALLILASDFGFTAIASRGSVVASSSRWLQTPILYSRSLLFFLEIVWHALGTVKVAFYRDPCITVDLWDSVETLLIVSWCYLLVLALLVYSVYDPAGSLKHNPRRDLADVEASSDVKRFFLAPSDKGQSKRRRLWFSRLRGRVFCCVDDTEDSREAYKYMANYMANFFEDVDITPSDMFSALVLIRKKQRRLLARTGSTTEEPREGMMVPYGAASSAVPVEKAPHSNGKHPSSPAAANGVAVVPQSATNGGVATSWLHQAPAWMNPEQALYYLKFAWGSYGWPAYMASHVCTGLCDLWAGIRCCSCLRGGSGNVSGDNCCECHLATVKHLTRVEPDDLLYSSFKNDLFRVPFYVALDHRTRAILVVARGTLSGADSLTDSMTNEAEFPPEMGRRGLCHEGVLKSALHIMEHLDAPLGQATARHPDYTLVLTGHSLGAAVAAVLGLMLRPRFPTLRCYAFSSPGGVLDVETARETRDFVLNIVVGDDMVCRLGFPQVESMKREVISSLLQCDENKNDLNSRGLEALFCGRRLTPPLKNKEAFDNINAPMGKLAESLRLPDKPGVQPASLEEILEKAVPYVCRPIMHMPGRILHFVREKKGAEYQMFWVAPEYFDHIVISPRCLKDHMPDVAYQALRSVCNVTTF